VSGRGMWRRAAWTSGAEVSHGRGWGSDKLQPWRGEDGERRGPGRGGPWGWGAYGSGWGGLTYGVDIWGPLIMEMQF
jgi:hypothetical protein